MFVSARTRRWVNCWLTQVANIHRCDADGTNIRQLSTTFDLAKDPLDVYAVERQYWDLFGWKP